MEKPVCAGKGPIRQGLTVMGPPQGSRTTPVYSLVAYLPLYSQEAAYPQLSPVYAYKPNLHDHLPTSMEKLVFAYFCSHSQFLKASLSLVLFSMVLVSLPETGSHSAL